MPRLAQALLAVVLALAGAGAAAGCGGGADARPADRTLAGELLGGGRYDPASHRGKVTVVNFWGSWCPPCRAETPDLVAAHAALKDDGVVFLGVNIRDPDRDKAEAFVTAFKVPYPSIYDPPGRLALTFDVPPSTIPTTLVLGRDGKPAKTFRDAIHRDELVAAVKQVLKDG